MSKLFDDYNDLLFPVRTVPVFAELRHADQPSLCPIPGQKAIVDCTNDRVISVVSSDYRLVSNRDALIYAHRCCEALFPDVPARAWRVRQAHAPESRGHCHMDIMHASAKLDFHWNAGGQQKDPYAPFVRVTNSYNRTRSLGFTIGFLRMVCGNGMILPSASVRFAFTHNTRRLGERIEFEISRKPYQNLRKDFLDFLRPLRRCAIGPAYFRPIALLALAVRAPKKPSNKEKNAWESFRGKVDSLGRTYAKDVGENAYALLNVVTDIASRPAKAGLRRREQHSLQRAAGAWLPSFSKKCAKESFDPKEYIQELTKAAAPRPEAAAGLAPVHGWQ